jgi:hypothetical protein
VFTFDAGTAPPSLTWIGCVVAPDPIGLNAVVALPDGGFAATNFDPRPPSGVPARGVSAKGPLGRSERRGLGMASQDRLGQGAGQRGVGRERSSSSRPTEVVLRRQWGNRAFMRLSRGKTPVERQEIPGGLPRRQPRAGRAMDGRSSWREQDRALAELPQGAGPWRRCRSSGASTRTR